LRFVDKRAFCAKKMRPLANVGIRQCQTQLDRSTSTHQRCTTVAYAGLIVPFLPENRVVIGLALCLRNGDQLNFTPKIIVESVFTGVLTVAVAGSTGSMAGSPTPAFAGQGASADRGYVEMNISAAEM
jgi:hypothetical protein